MKNTMNTLLPEEIRYTEAHVWVKKEGAELIMGITDFAQDELGEVMFVDLPHVAAQFAATQGFGSVESVKSVSTLYMPVSGEIIAVNALLDEVPATVNADCYGKGWMIRVKPTSLRDYDALMSAQTYRAGLG